MTAEPETRRPGTARERWARHTTALLVVVVAALVAAAAVRYRVTFDWTDAGRNTLSEASAAILGQATGPLSVIAYVRRDEVARRAVGALVDRYRRARPDIALEFVDPLLVPDEARRLGIGPGEILLVVEHDGRRADARVLTEHALTNALHRALRADTKYVAYVVGHGERDWQGDRREDVARLAAQLEARGFSFQRLALDSLGDVPANTAVLVLSRPATALGGTALDAIDRYLDRGGNLLWLEDPPPDASLDRLAARLGVQRLAGVVVEPSARPVAFPVVRAYATHPITAGLTAQTVYPVASALSWKTPAGWSGTGLLTTGLRAWLETGPLEGTVDFDPAADVAGPLTLAVAFERVVDADSNPPARQRVAVFGDGDFLSNAYVGNGGNLALGVRVMEWLAHDDALVAVPAVTPVDQRFEPGRAARAFIALGAPLGLPIAIAVAGLLRWRRRRHL